MDQGNQKNRGTAYITTRYWRENTFLWCAVWAFVSLQFALNTRTENGQFILLHSTQRTVCFPKHSVIWRCARYNILQAQDLWLLKEIGALLFPLYKHVLLFISCETLTLNHDDARPLEMLQQIWLAEARHSTNQKRLNRGARRSICIHSNCHSSLRLLWIWTFPVTKRGCHPFVSIKITSDNCWNNSCAGVALRMHGSES